MFISERRVHNLVLLDRSKNRPAISNIIKDLKWSEVLPKTVWLKQRLWNAINKVESRKFWKFRILFLVWNFPGSWQMIYPEHSLPVPKKYSQPFRIWRRARMSSQQPYIIHGGCSQDHICRILLKITFENTTLKSFSHGTKDLLICSEISCFLKVTVNKF